MSINTIEQLSPRPTARIVWLAILLIIAGLAFWGLSGRWFVARTAASRSVSTAEVATPEAQAGSEVDVEHAGRTEPSARLGANHLEPWPGAASWQAEYGCTDCPAAANIAHSVEEAAWLRRNGFDGRNERVALEALSKAELRARFDAGDLVAGAIYLEKMIEDREQGARQFADQLAARGSILVLYKLAGFYAKGPHANKWFFAAALRLAEMRGDRWAINEINAWQPVMNYDLDSSLIESRVQILLRNIEQARQEHGYPPLTIDIRPLPPQAQQTAMVGPGG